MKIRLPNRAKSLKFEPLESRELLSVNPLETCPGQIPDDVAATEAAERPEYAAAETIALTFNETRDAQNSTDDGVAPCPTDAMTILESQPEQETPSTVVTTDADVVDAYDGQISLREALGVYSSPGATIQFDAGMSGKTITLDPELGQLEVVGDVVLDASSLFDASTSTPGVTISGGGATRIMRIANDATVTIKGLTFTEGQIPSSEGDDGRFEGGGAILNHGALTVQDCVFSNNNSIIRYNDRQQTLVGPAILTGNSATTNAERCVFSGNKGEGVLTFYSNVSSTMTIKDCQIIDNERIGVWHSGSARVVVEGTTLSGNLYGVMLLGVGDLVVSNSLLANSLSCGACVIADRGGSLVVEDSVLTGNVDGVYLSHMFPSSHVRVSISRCEASGNGCFVRKTTSDDNGGSFVVEDCVMTGNNLVGDIKGGAVFSNCEMSSNQHGVSVKDKGSVSLVDTRIVNNVGAGIVCYGTVEATNVVIANNNSVGVGISSSGKVEATNVVIANNNVGGVNLYGELTLRNSTVTNNAVSSGGAGGVRMYGSAVLNAYNSIIAGNTSSKGNPDVGKENQSNLQKAKANAWNVLSSYTEWNTGADRYEYDASQPLFTDAAQGDYTLAPDSQAIDRGANAYVTFQTDIDGKPRVMGGVVDLGASEYGAAPSAVTISSYDSAARQAVLNWNAVPDAVSYSLMISEDDGETWTTAATGITTTTATAEGLEPGKSYVLRVVGLSEAGAPIATSYAEREFAPFALSRPDDTYGPTGSVDVTFEGASNATATIRWYEITENGEVEIVAARDKTSYTPLWKYDLKIVATGFGVSVGSDSTLVVAAAKTIRVIYDPSTRQASLFWPVVLDAASYKVQISRDGGETWLNYKSGLTTTSTTANGLYAGKSYVFRVVAFSNTGAALASSTIERVFAPVVVSVPGGSPVEFSYNSYEPGSTLTLSQTGAPNASSTIVWYSNGSGKYVEIPGTRGSLTYTSTPSDRNIKVEATGTGDSDGCSYRIYFDPARDAVVTVSSYDSSTRQAVLNWYTISNAATYKLQISKDGGETWTNYKTGLTTTTATVNGLYVGKTYAFRVYGVKRTGQTISVPYAEVVFTPTQPAAGAITVSSYDPSTRQAVLTWNAVPDAATYKLQISKDGGETWINYRSGLTTTSGTVNGLYVGKTYGFRVYGVSEAGKTLSGYSETTFSPTTASSATLDEVFADFFEEGFFEL